MSGRRAVAALVALALTGFGQAPEAPIRPPPPVAVARASNAEEQLARAAELRQTLRGKRGRERAAVLARAVAAYRAVREHFPKEQNVCAEAAFRAGELLRSSGDAESALAEFTLARAGPARGPFHARAGLEIGHVHRRDGRPAEALDAYLAVRAEDGAEARWRDDAALWAGRVYAAEERAEDARRVLEPVAKLAEDPLQRIDAFDELALLYIAARDLEAAAGELSRCREAVGDEALEETEQGERVRGALQRMRCIARLEQAIAARVRGVPIDRSR